MKRTFLAPKGFDIVDTYDDLEEYAEGFAAGCFSFMLLIGPPGTGKTTHVRKATEGYVKWIDNHATPLGLYCAVYHAEGKPVVLDDVGSLFKDRTAVSLMKSLTQTESLKHVSWQSTTKELEKRGVPECYATTSTLAIIANRWAATTEDMEAIQDRAVPVAFVPSASTLHKKVEADGWCDEEVLWFVSKHLAEIPELSMRDYRHASALKKAGTAWKEKMRKVWQR